MHLGFAAKSLARPELRSHDGRHWQNHPHLSVSLACLRDMFAYLASRSIRMYRMSSELAPYVTHPDLPAFHNQVDECRAELASLGAQARASGLRLSIHAAPHVVLNSPDAAMAQRSAAELAVYAAILDQMGLAADAVIITHLGGLYGDRLVARSRFADRLSALPVGVRARVALENDDSRFGVDDILWVHLQTGVRLVFDSLHHRINNREGIPVPGAVAACLATWPEGVTPKIHFSSPRTEFNIDPAPGAEIPRIRPPRWNNHADYVNPFEFIDFLRLVDGLRAFDVMLEVRAKDLALLQLRRDLLRYAPDLLLDLDSTPTPAGPTETLFSSGAPDALRPFGPHEGISDAR